MYLTKLDEKKKKIFLDLSFFLASVDGNFCDEEATMIQAYQSEMHIDYNPSLQRKDIEDILSEIQSCCTNEDKRIVLFEALGLVLVDGRYDEREKEIINHMASSFNLEDSFVKECEKNINDYILLQNRINNLILNG